MKNSSIVMFNRSSESKVSMTSLEIAEMTGKEHKHILRDIRNLAEQLRISNESRQGLVDYSKEYHRGDRTQYKFLSDKTIGVFSNFAFGENEQSLYSFKSSNYIDAKGESRTMYLLNKRACLLLTSGYSVELRARIIDRLEYLERSRATPQYELPDFNDPVAAARAWADAREGEVKALETVSTMKPKADYFDELVSRNLLTTFRETARELHIKESQFIKWLLEDGYIYRKPNGRLMPYADKCKLFEVKERISDRTSWAGTQTYITPRGRELFRNNYKSN